MSEDKLAHKDPPPSLSEATYDSIYATMIETVQGRRFLEEHILRNRQKEADAGAATQPADADTRDDAESLDLFLFDVADMAQVIARTKAEIAAVRPQPARNGKIDEAAGELDSIVQTTEQATSRILAAAERLQEIAWTLRETGLDESRCDQLDAQAMEIYTACSFQDLTGQRTRKVIQVLRYLEYRINSMIAIWGKDARRADEGSGVEKPAEVGRLSAAELDQLDVDVMLRPPASLKEDAPEDFLEQRQAPSHAELPEKPQDERPDQFAAVRQPEAPPVSEAELGEQSEQEAQEIRQEATLEDIERVMMALDPFVATRDDAASAERSGAPDKTAGPADEISFTERRPELSTAAAVSSEAAAVPSPDQAPMMQQTGPELPAERMERGETAESADDKSKAARQEPTEFGISARATGALLQVQAAAPRPAAEDTWSVLDRLAPDFLPQAAAPNPPPPRPSEADTASAAPPEAFAAIPPVDWGLPETVTAGAGEATVTPAPDLPTELLERRAEGQSLGEAEQAETVAAAEVPTGFLERQAGENSPSETEQAGAVAPAPEVPTELPELRAEGNSPSEAKEPEAMGTPASVPEPAPETDDFLFVPEPQEQESAPADFLLEPESLREPAPSENAAAATLDAASRRGAGSPYDPLAPLRALSDEEKIALFS